MTNACPVCGAEQTEGLLCHSCTSILERELGDVPAIVAELDVTLSKQGRIGSGGKGGLARERTPIHTGAMTVADDLQNTLTTWARDVSGAPGRSRPQDWVDTVQHTVAASWVLLHNIPEIRRHPAVTELVDEITDAIRQARRVIDRPADRQYLGQCLAEFEGVTCTEEIWARQGASEVACKVCGVTHEVVERRAWLLLQAEDMLCTVKEASRYMGEVGHITVTEASIRGYLQRGKRLAYRSGTNLIRLGDLMAVVLDEGERRTA